MKTPAEREEKALAQDDSTEVTPQGLMERQETITRYLLDRKQRRRRKFLLRGRLFTLKEELARNVYLAACILLDGLVIPQLALVLPSPWGWLAAATAFAAAVYVEWRVYRRFFSLFGAQSKPIKDRT